MKIQRRRYPLAATVLGIAVGMVLGVLNPWMVGWPIGLLGVLGLMVDMLLNAQSSVLTPQSSDRK